MLQMMDQSMGMIVDHTPKCHPELAGDGIKYSWGCCKKFYRQLSLQEKKRKDNFMSSMRKCLSTEVLDITQIWKFTKRAQEYICSYHVIWQETTQQDSTHLTAATNSSVDLTVTPMKIEKLIKKFKTHRCALDFSYGFCKALFKEY